METLANKQTNSGIESYFTSLYNNPSIIEDLPMSPWTKGPPPSFDDFCFSGRYIDPIELSPLQYESAINILGKDPKQIFSPERLISLGILCVGKGGGKGWWSALIMAYVITVILHIDDPQKYFQIDGHLDLINVAIKLEQAEKTAFSYFKFFIKKNKWILEHYHISLGGRLFNKANPESEFFGAIALGTGHADFPNDIRCSAQSSQNEGWEGLNVIFFILDEISGFISETEIQNGWAIYKTAIKSCISRRTTTFKGIGFVISFPRQEKNDIILSLLRKAKKTKWMYGVFATSYEFRLKSKYAQYDENGVEKTFEFFSPRFNRFFSKKDTAQKAMKGLKIPIFLEDDFISDPEGSMTSYLCLPPKTAGDWIEFPERVMACVRKDSLPMFRTVDYPEILTDEDGVEYPGLTKKITHCLESNPDIRNGFRYVAWLDAAEKHCDAVLAIARKELKRFTDSRGHETILEIAKIVDVITWSPKPDLPVNLVNVHDFLTTYIRQYINLKEVGADQWESVALSRKLLQNGIKPIRHNLLAEHYVAAKSFFYSGQVEIFDESYGSIGKDKGELTGIEQILSLKEGALGPSKRKGLKKDKSDAIVGCIFMLLGDNWTKQNRPTSQNLPGSIGRPITSGNGYINSPSNPFSHNRNFSPTIVQGGNNNSPIPDLKTLLGERKIGKPIGGLN